MIDGYAVLLLPLLVFVFFGMGAIWLYYRSRQFWRKALDASRGARFLYVTIAVVILPLILGGWSDIVDVSEVLQGKVTVANAVPLSVLAVLLVTYLYLHGCWFDREEHGLVTRANEIGRIAELDCQKNYLVRLLENFRACIGRYAARLSQVLDTEASTEPISKRIPDDLSTDNIRMIVESIRQTYRSIETVPKDYGLKALLLESRDGFLVHRESFDGTKWDCYKADCDAHREQYFNIAKPNCSVAVASAVSGTIQIIESCDDCHRDDSHPFWYFQDCLALQREELGSMVVIPIEPAHNHKYVLCITCSQAGAFLKKHIWKAKAVQENVQARIALLNCQNAILGTLCAESTEALGRIEDLECQLSSLEHQRSQQAARCDELMKEIAYSLKIQGELSEEMEVLKMAKDQSDARLSEATKRTEELSRQLDYQIKCNEKQASELKKLPNDLSKPMRKNVRRNVKGADGKDGTP
jgi:hypothetical protein